MINNYQCQKTLQEAVDVVRKQKITMIKVAHKHRIKMELVNEIN